MKCVVKITPRIAHCVQCIISIFRNCIRPWTTKDLIVVQVFPFWKLDRNIGSKDWIEDYRIATKKKCIHRQVRIHFLNWIIITDRIYTGTNRCSKTNCSALRGNVIEKIICIGLQNAIHIPTIIIKSAGWITGNGKCWMAIRSWRRLG